MKMEKWVIALSIACGLFIALIDAVLDYLVFYKEVRGTFLEMLLTDPPAHEVYMRLFILSTFAGFGVVVSWVMSRRRRAVDALRQSEERFRLLFERSPIGYQSLDADGRFLEVNPAWLDTLGYDRPEVAGQWFGDFLAPEYRDRFRERFPRFKEAGEVHGVQFEMVRKGGDRLIVEFDGRVGYDEQGDFKQTHCVLRDVTEQKQAQEALWESRRFLQTVVDAVPEMMLVVDRDHRVVLANRAAQASCESGDPLAAGTKCYQLTHRCSTPCAGPADPCPLEHVLATGEPVSVVHLHYDAGGNEIFVEINAAPIFDGRGEVVQMIESYRNVTERMRAEEALRESEARFRELFDNMSSGVAVYEAVDDGEDFVFKDFNLAGQRIERTAKDELIGRRLTEAFPRVREFGLLEVLQRVWRLGTPEHYPVSFYQDERIAGWRENYVYRLPSGEVVAIFDDVTEQKRAEEELAKTQALLSASIEQTPAGLLIADAPDVRIRIANSAALGIRGTTEEPLTNIPADLHPRNWQTFHPDGTPFAPEDLPLSRAILKGETSRNVDVIIRRSSGERRWILGNAGPVRNAKGEIVAGVVVFPDVTELKQAEGQLRLDELRLEALLRLSQMTAAPMQEITDFALEEAVGLTKSKIGYLAFMNEDETVLTMHAWSKTAMAQCEIIDKPIVYPMETTGLWGEAVRQRKPVITNDYLAPNPLKKGHPTGHVHVTRHMNVPVFDGEQIVAVAGVGNKEEPYDESDVRQLALLMEGMWMLLQRKRTGQQREQLIGKLEAQNAELERFTYTVSHDLKSPLITIKGYLGLLEKDIAGGKHEAVTDDMGRMSRAADKMEELLDELLELSRVGRMVNPSEQVPLADLAREAVELVAGQIAERGVAVEISPELPVIFGDRARLREVLQNLVENAVKYMGDQSRPRIEIGARLGQREPICYIRDNGLGIEPRYQEKVFGLFDQLDSRAEGTGIGLALVKRIIEVHGGRVWVESEGLGRGATFCFVTAPQPKTENES